MSGTACFISHEKWQAETARGGREAAEVGVAAGGAEGTGAAAATAAAGVVAAVLVTARQHRLFARFLSRLMALSDVGEIQKLRAG